MSSSPSLNRREFLCSTATAAVGLSVIGTVAASPALSNVTDLIDVNVSLGRWPTRRLPFGDTRSLVRKLRQQGLTQAWAGSFDAAFGSDLGAANASLARECERNGRGMLLPFGTVNPLLPDWEAEFQRCRDQHRMRGLRLFPNYHRYQLGGAAFGKLFSLAVQQRLIIQIAVSLEDERTQPAAAQVPHVDVSPLLALIKYVPAARVVLLNWSRGVKPDQVKALAALGVGFDIATLENVGGVANLLGQIAPDRVMFGSHAPFFYFEAARLKLQESALDPAVLRAVSRDNARRLLA